ncbi:AAA-type ATPase family protein isoform 10 [Hibiscus syriacus]|uniref:AAA-type ATPase family protein isoform 10 n=1 Tax=Hibiscus syriacus TaxID=106335 RepID=A0A6A3D3E8_HIBSY|nr:AAA-type ATPase family protein isoform 10 [Hibiscus syriacus]
MDGRRHSVDIPISRTLIALRRVRSLRDPSTNSMSKFSSLFDNVKGPEYEGFHERREDQGCDFGLHSVPEDSNSKLIICENAAKVGNRAGKVDEFDDCNGDSTNYGVNKEEVQKYSPLAERYDSNFNVKGMSLICMAPSCNSDDLASCNEPVIGFFSADRINHCNSKGKCQSRNQVNSYGANGDVACPSIDAISSYSTSLYVDENVDTADLNHRGCGISYCWSKTPRLRESNPSSDFEDFPLLSSDTGDKTFCGQSFWKCINGEINPYSVTPRSLGQKFKPKSFDELVGQSVVVRSLLSAITKGRVASFYLFYGPRGTGKTCASRIFAAALNCLSLEEHKPCGRCRECIMFFSGRSRDVKEADSLRINRSDRLRSLVKNAVSLLVSSRFKIFIIDECQLLHGETWATVLNIPRETFSACCFRYEYPRTRYAATKLEKICIEERLDYDQAALGFIAAKSNGSLRDAEMMLDQLSLLGKKITMSLTYELVIEVPFCSWGRWQLGTVSDDELLDLLDLALSCNTSNTVMRPGDNEVAQKPEESFLKSILNSCISTMVSELNLQMNLQAFALSIECFIVSSVANCIIKLSLLKLSHALRALSETEKHSRVSKNQTTWLTVALLRLSSMESNFMNTNDSKLCLPNAQHKDSDSSSTSSTGARSNHPFTCMCNGIKSSKLAKWDESERSLESIWNKATELCQSGSLKKFLRKRGKLSSLHFNQALAIAELEFCHPNHNHSIQEPDYQSNCFPIALRSQKKVHLSNTAKTISATSQEENKLALSISGVCSNDPYVFYSSDNKDRLRENSEVLCWRTPTIPLKKAWPLTYNHRSRRLPHIADWVLPSRLLCKFIEDSRKL